MANLYFLICLAWLYGAIVEATTCPITEVKQYRYSCNKTGTVQNPVYISQTSGVKDVETCAESCLENIKCHSFNYAANTTECNLYELHFENMKFTRSPRSAGSFYDRYCYSTNCNEISACNAIQSCKFEDFGDGGTEFTNFACGYGITSIFDAESTTETVTFQKDFDACKAARQCAHQQANDIGGPFEVHWDLVKKQWLCFLTPFPAHGHYGAFDRKENNITHQTFTVKDKSVGASYGYYLSTYL